MTGRMSAPAQEVVRSSGLWWRDTGAQHREKKAYTVDAWGRRRGPCEQGGSEMGLAHGGKDTHLNPSKST